MHHCHVAHRYAFCRRDYLDSHSYQSCSDCMAPNIMMDPRPIYPKMFHPHEIDMDREYKRKAKHGTRTAHPVKYYLIDFGLSRKYDAENTSPLEIPILGGDKSVPEFQNDAMGPFNPFHTDIYYIGNMIRQHFLLV